MRRNKTLKRGRVVPVLVAGGIGYLIGGMHSQALHSTGLSAAEAISLRFPAAWSNPSDMTGVTASAAATNVSAASATADAQLALLNPEPMIPQAPPQATPQATPQMAATEDSGASPATDANEQSQAVPGAPVAAQPPSEPQMTQPPRATKSVAPPAELKPIAVAAHRRVVNRPGYMLNDEQIASIKERLNLTPDQEQMWPAVEAALRNMAYTRVQEARSRAAPATNEQVAAVDPDAVQGLKSAAVPLILSFNDEQKEEVRNIVHVMGLDQLASQF